MSAGERFETAVFVCDTWLSFQDDTAVYAWSRLLLQNSWPDAALLPHARVEAIVGHKHLNDQTRTQMRDLMLHLMQRARLPHHQYRLEWLDIEVQLPSMRIWGITAVLQP